MSEIMKFHNYLVKDNGSSKSTGRWFVWSFVLFIVFQLSQSLSLTTHFLSEFTDSSLWWILLAMSFNVFGNQIVNEKYEISKKKRFWYSLGMVIVYLILSFVLLMILGLFVSLVGSIFSEAFRNDFLSNTLFFSYDWKQVVITSLMAIQIFFVGLPLLWVWDKKQWYIRFLLSLLIVIIINYLFQLWFNNLNQITILFIATYGIWTLLFIVIQYFHSLRNMSHNNY